MSQTIETIQHFAELTEPEFYRIKGAINILYYAPPEDILMILEADGDMRDELMSNLASQYLIDNSNVGVTK
jgi:hypothetical protein